MPGLLIRQPGSRNEWKGRNLFTCTFCAPIDKLRTHAQYYINCYPTSPRSEPKTESIRAKTEISIAAAVDFVFEPIVLYKHNAQYLIQFRFSTLY